MVYTTIKTGQYSKTPPNACARSPNQNKANIDTCGVREGQSIKEMHGAAKFNYSNVIVISFSWPKSSSNSSAQALCSKLIGAIGAVMAELSEGLVRLGFCSGAVLERLRPDLVNTTTVATVPAAAVAAMVGVPLYGEPISGFATDSNGCGVENVDFDGGADKLLSSMLSFLSGVCDRSSFIGGSVDS